MDEKEGLHDALLRRAHEAVTRAGQVADRSRVLVHVSARLHDRGLTRRCAWCGRWDVGGEWVQVGRMPQFAVTATASHSICPDCVSELRAAGRSS